MNDPKTRQEKYKRREKFPTLGTQKHIRAFEALMEKRASNTTSNKGSKKK